jgi:DNA topoisomerase-1
VTLEEALHLLSQPKAQGRGRAAPREPLKTFDVSPVTGQPVKVLSGKYGNYVADGVTNATLPKGVMVEELTFAEALNLLGERAARGPAKGKPRRGGRASPKPAAKKAAAPKSKAAPKKKAAKRAAKAKGRG